MAEKSTQNTYIRQELEGANLAVPSGFFDIGKSAAESFFNGFLSQLEDALATSMAADFAANSGKSVEPAQSNVSIHYHFAASGETIAQQIQTAKNAGEIEKLRGGY